MKQVEVTILGQSYLLACPEGGEALLQAAVASVDREMSGIRDAGKVKARERRLSRSSETARNCCSSKVFVRFCSSCRSRSRSMRSARSGSRDMGRGRWGDKDPL